MATAFVTGGSGFVAGRLIERLVADGWTVRGLARSDAAAERIGARGGEAVRGDVTDVSALAAGARGADVAFHAAAKVGDSGPWAEFERVNVEGTRAVLRAAREVGVKRLVHVGTEAALLRGQPLFHADERYPLAFDSPVHYCRSKALAEAAVIEANGDGFETVVVRPRFVWGTGDTVLLPAMVELARSGRLRWVGGGRQRTSTTHVDNVAHGLRLAAERGTPGAAYFVTDGEPVVFREFVSALLGTQGVAAPRGSVPRPLARGAAAATETAWRLLRRDDAPPVTRFAVWIASLECTLDDSKARRELGYAPVVSRADGLRALRAP